MSPLRIRGHSIIRGVAEGEALVSQQNFMFAHGVDPKTGIITDRKHELHGRSIKGKVFVFPQGKGSTTGSTWVLETIRQGNAPAAVINLETEPIIATGFILGELFYGKSIPVMDRLEKNPLHSIKTGDHVKVNSRAGYVEILPAT